MTLRRTFFALAFFSVSLAPGCGGAPAPADAGSDAPAAPDTGPECTSAMDCDDGLFCNGTESCSTAGRCVLGTPMRCDDSVACTVDSCSESLRACVFHVPDVDMDGIGDASCVDGAGVPLGTDCDDHDANRYPGNHEVCDAMMHDEDCDPTTHGGLDADGDGYESSQCCNGTMCGTDCNDGLRSAHPGAVEVCNGIDDNCDTVIDEGVTIDVYVDADHDGDGAMSAAVMQACASTAGVSVYHTDCDDADRTRSGRLIEVCDMIDNDCDGVVDDHTSDVTWYRDADMDGFGSATSGTLVSCVPPTGYSLLGTDCDDTTNTRSPARAEICDGLDDDCNGRADFVISAGNGEDDDGDGIADIACGAPYGHDCDDNDPTTGGSTTPEACDGRDNDCDMIIDEGATPMAFFRDMDGDGYGAESSGTIVACVPSAGYVRMGGDCDDTSPTRHPGGMEGCNAVDDDCDGAVDEGSASASCVLAHTQEVCISGVCSPVACDSGYDDCTFLVAGCETNLASDSANCGHCGSACPTLSYCNAGACTSVSTTGVIAHYDARNAGTIVMSTGPGVIQWIDLSASGADLFASAPPMLVSAGINGHPALDFAAAGMVTSLPFALNAEISVFIVLQYRAPEQWGCFAHHGNRDGDWSMEQSGFDPTTSGIVHFQSVNDNTGDELTLTEGTNYVLFGRISAGNREFSATSSTGTVSTSATGSSISPRSVQLYVGASDAGEHSNALIGEIVYYDHAVTNAERDAIIAYLRNGWGI